MRIWRIAKVWGSTEAELRRRKVMRWFLSVEDAGRARLTLEKLRRHGLAPLVLTGGFAVELHLLQRGFAAQMRTLHDIDFLAETFASIPATLAEDFLFNQVHPHDPPGKTLMQAVDPATSVRVDVFRAYGEVWSRAEAVEVDGFAVRMITLEDLIARATRLCLNLAAGTPIPAKHARDLLRLLPIADVDRVETVWAEHRKAGQHPESFAEAEALVRDLIVSRRDLLIVPEYLQDADAACSRCEATKAFPLAQGAVILELLGYR
jgi:hypothetical protein